MNRYFLCLSLLVVILFISSCMKGSSRMIIDDSMEKSDSKMEQVLETIKNKDKEDLNSLFSAQILDEIEDFDERIDYLFGFIQGEIGLWERIGGPVENETINYGHITKKICTWYNVNTDIENYIILIRECITDTDNPENVGLYMLKAIKADEKDILFDSQVIGIYKPEK